MERTMGEIGKPWDWTKNTQDFWNEPSEDSYYLLHRWKGMGFSRFLDLGCGLGRHSLQFAKSGFRVDAFDLSTVAIDRLRETCARSGVGGIECATGDMSELPYPDETFDCLLAYHVISHTDTKGIGTIIGEIRRVLKVGGEFYLTLCSKNSWSFRNAGFPRLDENTVVKVEDGPENGIPHFYSDDDTIAELFKDFRLIRVRHVQDLMFGGESLRDSWHYFLLGMKI